MVGLIEDYVPDERMWPKIVQLATCLCNELDDRGLRPGNCFCGVMPGSEAVWDYQNGLAWVRLVNAGLTTTFPNPILEPNGVCAAGLVAQVEIGVLHCGAPIIDPASGAFPSQDETDEVARIQFASMEAMRRAMTCCDIDLMVVGQYTPLGPSGGLFGGRWLVQIGDD